MRRRNALLAAAALAAAALVAGAAAAREGDGGEAGPGDLAAAKAAEDEALALGRKVFADASLGSGDRSCSTCHDNPKRPDLSLKGAVARHPRWDRAAGRVITIQEKFRQMQERNLRAGKVLPLGDPRWTALEMHLGRLP